MDLTARGNGQSGCSVAIADWIRFDPQFRLQLWRFAAGARAPVDRAAEAALGANSIRPAGLLRNQEAVSADQWGPSHCMLVDGFGGVRTKPQPLLSAGHAHPRNRFLSVRALCSQLQRYLTISASSASLTCRQPVAKPRRSDRCASSKGQRRFEWLKYRYSSATVVMMTRLGR